MCLLRRRGRDMCVEHPIPIVTCAFSAMAGRGMCARNTGESWSVCLLRRRGRDMRVKYIFSGVM